MHNINNCFLLSELITTRICHDLAGTSGAIMNGVEFLSANDDFAQEAKDLITSSSIAISSKIKIFRLAFGLIDKKNTDLEYLKKTLNDYLLDNNIAITWKVANTATNNDTNLQMLLGKIAILLCLTSLDTIPRGGNLNIHLYEANNQLIKVSMSSAKLIINQDFAKLIDMINNKNDFSEILKEATPKTLPLAYVAMLAVNINSRLKVTHNQNLLDLIVENI